MHTAGAYNKSRLWGFCPKVVVEQVGVNSALGKVPAKPHVEGCARRRLEYAVLGSGGEVKRPV
jgi:hypothetical protein